MGMAHVNEPLKNYTVILSRTTYLQHNKEVIFSYLHISYSICEPFSFILISLGTYLYIYFLSVYILYSGRKKTMKPLYIKYILLFGIKKKVHSAILGKSNKFSEEYNWAYVLIIMAFDERMSTVSNTQRK